MHVGMEGISTPLTEKKDTIPSASAKKNCINVAVSIQYDEPVRSPSTTMDSMQSSIPHTLTMQNPTQVPVPRPGQPTAGFIHRSNAYSPAIHAWLLQDESEVPWHNLASIVVSSTSQDISQPDLTGLPSDNPATQGSVKCDNTVAGMATAHIQGQVALCPSTFHVSSTHTDLDRQALVQRPNTFRVEAGTSLQPTERALKHKAGSQRRLGHVVIGHQAIRKLEQLPLFLARRRLVVAKR